MKRYECVNKHFMVSVVTTKWNRNKDNMEFDDFRLGTQTDLCLLCAESMI